MKFCTFRITISVPGDLDTECSDRIVNWCRKQCRHAYVVCEQGASAKRHLHAAICLKTPAEGNNVIGYLWKIVQDHHPKAIRKFAMNKHVMYDHSWYDEYLRKEDHCEVLYAKYDRDEVTSYFPADAEQEILRTHVLEGTNDKPADPYMDRLEREWIEYDPHDAEYESAGRFLNYIMFVARTERCISDNRRFNQVAWTLYKYRNRRLQVDADFVNYGQTMTGQYNARFGAS